MAQTLPPVLLVDQVVAAEMLHQRNLRGRATLLRLHQVKATQGVMGLIQHQRVVVAGVVA